MLALCLIYLPFNRAMVCLYWIRCRRLVLLGLVPVLFPAIPARTQGRHDPSDSVVDKSSQVCVVLTLLAPRHTVGARGCAEAKRCDSLSCRTAVTSAKVGRITELDQRRVVEHPVRTQSSEVGNAYLVGEKFMRYPQPSHFYVTPPVTQTGEIN